ncbi:MAG: hypothetical protein ACLSAF_04895 [Intestinimonas sp.]
MAANLQPITDFKISTGEVTGVESNVGKEAPNQSQSGSRSGQRPHPAKQGR